MENINDVYGCNPCSRWRGTHGKLEATLPLKQMTIYEQWMKVGAMLFPPTLNRQL